ncbi:MAG: hypothetical protein LiPW15_111 [Parcubacteria group bacterium LiPW_15]|nr:MAG: hypothetical protein LiPW15_111 [Parcubacteria group bacterium LiPW_15]
MPKKLATFLVVVLAISTIVCSCLLVYKVGERAGFGEVVKMRSVTADGLIRITRSRADWPLHPSRVRSLTRFYDARGEVVQEAYVVGYVDGDVFITEAVVAREGTIILYCVANKTVPLTRQAKREAHLLLAEERMKFGLATP